MIDWNNPSPAAMAAAEWFNTTSKQLVIEWATSVGLDIGQGRWELDDDWAERVIERCAAQLGDAHR